MLKRTLFLLAATVCLLSITGATAAQEIPSKKFYTEITLHNNTSKTPDIHTVDIVTSGKTSNLYPLGYNYSVTLEDENTVYFRKNIPVTFTGLTVTPRGLYNTTKELWLPYYQNATMLTVRYDGKVLRRYDMSLRLCEQTDGICSQYCLGKQVDLDCTCGNNACEEIENDRNCPLDCLSDEDRQNVDNDNTGNGGGDDQNSTPRIGFSLWMLIPLILILGGIMYYLYREVEIK
jgi:hypothetical protein